MKNRTAGVTDHRLKHRVEQVGRELLFVLKDFDCVVDPVVLTSQVLSV